MKIATFWIIIGGLVFAGVVFVCVGVLFFLDITGQIPIQAYIISSYTIWSLSATPYLYYGIKFLVDKVGRKKAIGNMRERSVT